MTEAMIVEAVRAVQSGVYADPTIGGSTAASVAVANPAAVERFQAAMGVTGANSISAVDPIPFAIEASAAWRSAQVNNQGILHRIRALSQLGGMNGPSAPEMIELQYEVMNLAFQQEVVTKVADKSSNAVQTLIKNQ